MAKNPTQLKIKLFKDIGESTTLEELNQNLGQEFKTNSAILRKDLDKLVVHTIKYEDLIDRGAKLTANIEKLFATLSSINLVDLEVSQIEGSFNDVKLNTKALFDSRFFNGKEFGHADITVVGVRLGALAAALQGLEDNIIRAKRGVPKREGSIKVPEATGLPVKTVAQLRSLKSEIQKLFLACRFIERLPINTSLNSAQKYSSIANELNKVSNLQELLTIEKQKVFDTLTGKSKLRLKVESKQYNRYKAFFERAFGRNATSLLNKGYPEAKFKKYFLNKVDIGNLVGSKSITRKIKDDIMDIAAGKKPKKETTGKRTSKKVKSAAQGIRKNTVAPKLNNLATKAAAAKAVVNSATLRTKERESQGLGVRELKKIQTKINARLPAEVRRNMGRPALINRTGRFSNSVELTSLRDTGKTLTGDYTYMHNPYRTFENEGQRQWPVGYNPKPLIAKSIRGLAEQYIDRKFTLRRV